jgi:tetratricopeptide (TPR) repeat protein
MVLILTLTFIAPMAGQKHKKYTRQGNRSYEDNNFGDSEMLYRRAVDADPAFNKAIFNLGDALYKQEKYEEALDNFKEISGRDTDRDLLADSYYNMGNTLLKSGKIEESIEAYKNALRNDPSNMEAKYNLAYAQDLLDQQKNQQQQQQDQQQKDQQQQDNQQSQGENEDQQQQQGDQEQDQDQQQQDQQQQQQQQQQGEQQMSREDAERLLQALAENEKEVQEKVKKEKAARARIRTLKNW